MTELMRLIQAHQDRYGVTRAEVARRIGTKPQTVQNWINRPTTLPAAEHLRGVAEVIGLPYLLVLDAALMDSGYRTSLADDSKTLQERVRRAVEADPAILDDLWYLISQLRAEAAHRREESAPARRRSEDAEARAAADLIARIIRDQLHADDGDDGGKEAR